MQIFSEKVNEMNQMNHFLKHFFHAFGGNRLPLSQSFYSKKDFRLQPAAISIRTLSMPPFFLVNIAQFFSASCVPHKY